MKKYSIKINLYQKFYLQIFCENLIRDTHNLNCQNGTDWDVSNSNPEKFADFAMHYNKLEGFCKAIQMRFELDKVKEEIRIYDFKDNLLYKANRNENVIDDIDDAAMELSIYGW